MFDTTASYFLSRVSKRIKQNSLLFSILTVSLNAFSLDIDNSLNSGSLLLVKRESLSPT
jgi:hypothetical protein